MQIAPDAIIIVLLLINLMFQLEMNVILGRVFSKCCLREAVFEFAGSCFLRNRSSSPLSELVNY